MKTFITLALLSLSYAAFAHFEPAKITTTNGNTLDALVDVYSLGILIGNVDALVCIVDKDTINLALHSISEIKLGKDYYHVLTLEEEGEDLFDEPAVVSHLVLAKLMISGSVNLYEYYYSGNSRFDNGKANKSFAKALHKRPVLRLKKQAMVVFRSTYKFCLKSYFPNSYDNIRANQLTYQQLAEAVVEGNRQNRE